MRYRIKLSKLGAGLTGILGLYMFVSYFVLPQQRKLVVPSGIHAVSSSAVAAAYADQDIFVIGHDDQGNPIHAKHGDDDDVCFSYNGILLISFADEDGFATVFFLYILNQLLYAEKHKLLPWIHLDSPTNIHVYDDKEHALPGGGEQKILELTVLNGLHWDNFTDPHNGQTYEYPGTPILDYQHPQSTTSEVTIQGTGIWTSYFDLPSRLHPLRHLLYPTLHHSLGHQSSSTCHTKPIFQLTLKQIEPSLMVYCPYCVRAWRRKSTPPALAQWQWPYQQWFDPMRRQAHGVVRRHYRPTEHLTQLAHAANPVVASEDACLALHIRHSDKADRRTPLALQEFRPYVDRYIQAALWVGTTIVIYVATDSNAVLTQIQQEWPVTVTTYIRYQAGDVVRSDNTTAVFTLSTSHHKTNTEVMVDILAMAECEFMVHGMSAVTEAVHYLNLNLHNQSVNLEEEDASGTYLHKRKATMSPQDFGTLVRTRLDEKRRKTEAQKKKGWVEEEDEKEQLP